MESDSSSKQTNLYDYLFQPPNSNVTLERVTGVLQVNCTREEFADIANKNSPFGVKFDCELQISIQMAMFGYLRRFGSAIDVIINNLMRQVGHTWESLSHIQPGSFWNSNIVTNLIKDLYRKINGISVINLSRGLITWYVYAAENNFDPKFIADLNSKNNVSGDDADAIIEFVNATKEFPDSLRIFPTYAHLSLNSNSPPETFWFLVNSFKQNKINKTTFLDALIRFCQANNGEYRGFAHEFKDPNGNEYPGASGYAHIFDSFFQSQDDFNLFQKYLIFPNIMSPNLLYSRCAHLVLFKPENDQLSSGFHRWPMAFIKDGKFSRLKGETNPMLMKIALSRFIINATVSALNQK